MTHAEQYAAEPEYDRATGDMLRLRASRGQDFAKQIIETTRPFLSTDVSQLSVLDVGSGYGYTTAALAQYCDRVTGLEPSRPLYEHALTLSTSADTQKCSFHNQSLYDLKAHEEYDLIVLDNVFEHLPDQPTALRLLDKAMRPGAVLYILVPNKLWPIEVHYKLPFLSYLPLRLANLYLKLTRRGTDYTDASYAPTYFSLNRMLRKHTGLIFQYTLPASLDLTTTGARLHYRVGAALLRCFPFLWTISKALLVVAKKEHHSTEQYSNNTKQQSNI